MTLTKSLSAFTTIAALIGITWISAQSRQASATLSAQDYVEILQLYGYYTRDVDPGSEQNAAWLYTKDGTFEFRGQKHTGQKALQEFYEGVRKRQAFGIRHLNSNFLLLPTKDGARGTAYMVQIERREASKPIAATLFGVYHDTFAKTADGWRFTSRVLKQDGPDAPLP